MILSLEQQLCDDQDLSQVAGSYYSTNIFDRGAPGTPKYAAAALNIDMGQGNPIPFDVIVTEAFVGATATVSFSLEMDTTSAFGSATTVMTTAAIPVATLVVGYDPFQGLWLPLGITEQFLRLKFVIATATTTAGTVSAYIASGGRRRNHPYV